jgi:hypothetical protein
MEMAGRPLPRPCLCLSVCLFVCVTSVPGGITDMPFIVVTKLQVA